MAETRLILGMMSGTSCDGVSICLARASGPADARRYEVVGGREAPFPTSLRETVFSLYPPNVFSAHALLRAHLAIGRFMGEAARESLAEWGNAGEVKAISMHGPVIIHDPPAEPNGFQGGQIELGEAAVVAEATGLPTLSELRAADAAAGGHGAPLSSYVDYLLFRDERRGRAIQNLGGIANVTPLFPGVRAGDVTAFDTGPANMVIDGVMQLLTDGEAAMDRDGARAARGVVHPGLLETLLSHPYFHQPPPKTTGREMFGLPYAREVVRRARAMGLEPDDIVATATMLTARSIRLAYERFILPHGPIDEVVLGGGGAKNPTLVRMLREELAPIKLAFHEDYGIPSELREAFTWAILADQTLLGRAGNLPRATGASHPVVLGKLTFGRASG